LKSASSGVKQKTASSPRGAARTLLTLVAFFAGGGLLLLLEGALLTPKRPALAVTVSAGATDAEVARAVDEALLVQRGLQLGWRNDPLIVDRLTRALAEVTPEGTAVLDHAEALGLHTRDPLVRARLMENARRSLPEPASPAEAELEAWFTAHATRFQRPARLTFDHRFTKDAARADRMLAAASGVGEVEVDRGEPELTLGPRPVRTMVALAAALGGDAAATIARAPLNAWLTVRSPLGHHIVRVVARESAAVPMLAEIRPEVIAAWREDQRPVFASKAMGHLRSTFDVTVTRLPPTTSEVP